MRRVRGYQGLNLTFNLLNPNVIEGMVYDATGRPVPFAKVFLYRWDGGANSPAITVPRPVTAQTGSGVCDANGFYRFAVLPAGDYRVNASESTFSDSGS